MKKILKYIIILLFTIKMNSSIAQILINQGTYFNATSGVNIYIGGGFENTNNSNTNINNQNNNPAELLITGDLINNATILCDGHIKLYGNWINNNTFSSGIGTVFLEGNNQILSGTSSTIFHNLTLSGTGIKSLNIDKKCNGILNLNDRELATQTFSFYVINPSPDAIQRTTGFVSSLNGGFLSRVTNTNSSYLFPVGSSFGSLKYRPVEITPINNDQNTYTVRMANVNPLIESYNPDNHSGEICEINNSYYHQINRTIGNSYAKISIFYDPIADGNWDGIANWKTNPNNQWQSITSSYTIADNPMNKAIIDNWNDFSNIPYALFKSSTTVSFNEFGPFCVGSPNFTLPNTSIEGISGTWNPSYVNTSIPGSYTFTFTPNTSYYCSSNYTTNIDVINCCNLSITTNVTYPKCFGDNGIITFSAINGIPPYVFSINGNNAQSPYFAPSGNYLIIVNDSNGCYDTAIISISQPQQLNLLYETTNISCSGLKDGKIFINAQGGTSPYNFGIIHNGIILPGQNHNNLNSGNYTVFVKDANFCTKQTEVSISEPYPLSASLIISNPSCIGNNDGEIEINVQGGTYPYNFYYNENLTDTNILTGLHEGTYNITITDANNCKYILNGISLSDNLNECINIPNAFTPNNDGINDTWLIDNIELFPNTIMQVFNRWGQKLWEGYPGENWDGKYNGNLLPAGPYIYVINLNNGTKAYVGIVTLLY